jgi:hypothetical protein
LRDLVGVIWVEAEAVHLDWIVVTDGKAAVTRGWLRGDLTLEDRRVVLV